MMKRYDTFVLGWDGRWQICEMLSRAELGTHVQEEHSMTIAKAGEWGGRVEELRADVLYTITTPAVTAPPRCPCSYLWHDFTFFPPCI